MTPTLRRVAGADLRTDNPPIMGAEDFAHFAQKVPALYIGLGAVPAGTDVDKAAPNHSPRWLADDKALLVGVRALASLAVDYLLSAATGAAPPLTRSGRHRGGLEGVVQAGRGGVLLGDEAGQVLAAGARRRGPRRRARGPCRRRWPSGRRDRG